MTTPSNLRTLLDEYLREATPNMFFNAIPRRRRSRRPVTNEVSSGFLR
ncbi:MAG: hypothetical protein IAE89_08480 [Anaerolineae bacterium]|nr:hypothetical protein [Anaerolineae bacterium]